MPFPGLTIVGERINPGFASSKAILDKRDIRAIQDLAVSQVGKGAQFLTLNIGEAATTDPQFLAEVIRAIQAVCDAPISFDYPHASVQEVCLRTYDPIKARGRKPIVNSITESRWDMLDVLRLQPARVVLMASERVEGGVEVPNRTAQEILLTARRIVRRALNSGYRLTPDDLYIDVSLCPIASDTEGLIRRAVDAISLIGVDPELRGTHIVVGLSNLGIMLPKLALDGGKLSVRIESAFLTLTVPRGLDTILGTPGREYEPLPENDFVFRGFRDAIELEGYDALLRVQQLYRKVEA